jgi:hypothetical protein
VNSGVAAPRRRWWLWALAIVGGLVVTAAIGVVIWAMTPLGPMPEAVAALDSDAAVNVDDSGPIIFTPVAGTPRTGFILYPGARVDPVSYAPALRAVAEEGFLAVAVPMPLNLAVLGSGRAADVIGDHPEVQRWAVGGHSLGGAMAAAFAADNPDIVDALVLWAAYPPSGDDLSQSGLAVASISATEDDLTTPDDIEQSRSLLPPDTEFVAIEGGNHAQFGWYGEQRGDGAATIGRPEQQDQVVAATVRILRAIDEAE